MTVLDTVPLSVPVNIRDLGGIPIAGGTLCSGMALRADDLSTITPTFARGLIDDDLSTVIDLRSAEEVTLTGRGPLGVLPVTYHHIPLITDLSSTMRNADAWFTPRDYGTNYATMVETSAAPLVTALAIMAFSPGTTAFHCAAGKDRTGVLAASLLLILGASDEAIVTDYARTEPNLTRIHERLIPVMGPLFTHMGYDIEGPARAATDTRFDATAMSHMLELLRTGHGDPLGPLRAAGLSDNLIAALRTRGRSQ